MTSISRTDRLLQSIRAHALAHRGTLAGARQPAGGQASGLPPSMSVASLVAQRIEEIDAGDPQQRQRVFRAFLEGSLLEMFGVEAVGEPAFQRVLDQVEHAMSGSPDMAGAVDRLTDRLLGGVADGRNRQELETVFGRKL